MFINQDTNRLVWCHRFINYNWNYCYKLLKAGTLNNLIRATDRWLARCSEHGPCCWNGVDIGFMKLHALDRVRVRRRRSSDGCSCGVARECRRAGVISLIKWRGRGRRGKGAAAITACLLWQLFHLHPPPPDPAAPRPCPLASVQVSKFVISRYALPQLTKAKNVPYGGILQGIIFLYLMNR